MNKCIECGKERNDLIALIAFGGQAWGYMCEECNEKRLEGEGE